MLKGNNLNYAYPKRNYSSDPKMRIEEDICVKKLAISYFKIYKKSFLLYNKDIKCINCLLKIKENLKFKFLRN